MGFLPDRPTWWGFIQTEQQSRLIYGGKEPRHGFNPFLTTARLHCKCCLLPTYHHGVGRSLLSFLLYLKRVPAAKVPTVLFMRKLSL